MIGSKAQMKLNMGNTAQMAGPKELAKMGASGGGLGSSIGGALSGLAGLMGGQEAPMPAAPALSNPLAGAQGQAPVNGAQWRPIQPMQQPAAPMGMFNRLNPMMGRNLG